MADTSEGQGQGQGHGQGHFYRDADMRPIPDPTVLTNQAVTQASEMLRREIAASANFLSARLDAMDEATRLRTATATTDTDHQIQHLKELHDKSFGEKFESIQTQFKERDERVRQTATDTKTAVDAALKAQQEAVGKQNEASALANSKSEDAFTKQIDALVALLRTNTEALNGAINDLKERVLLIEGRTVGLAAGNTAHQSANSFVAYLLFGAFGLLVGIGGLIVAIVKP